ncbi:hypothetical protein HYQ46_000942 [Verticillium longisporum]|nr:hypothetical protein HYQ46_000942 [Verticillium longisporum]
MVILCGVQLHGTQSRRHLIDGVVGVGANLGWLRGVARHLVRHWLVRRPATPENPREDTRHRCTRLIRAHGRAGVLLTAASYGVLSPAPSAAPPHCKRSNKACTNDADHDADNLCRRQALARARLWCRRRIRAVLWLIDLGNLGVGNGILWEFSLINRKDVTVIFGDHVGLLHESTTDYECVSGVVGSP